MKNITLKPMTQVALLDRLRCAEQELRKGHLFDVARYHGQVRAYITEAQEEAAQESVQDIYRRLVAVAREYHAAIGGHEQDATETILQGLAEAFGEDEATPSLADRFRESTGYATLGHVVESVLLDWTDLGDVYDHDRIIEAVEMAPDHFWNLLLKSGIDAMAYNLLEGFEKVDREESGT